MDGELRGGSQTPLLSRAWRPVPGLRTGAFAWQMQMRWSQRRGVPCPARPISPGQGTRTKWLSPASSTSSQTELQGLGGRPGPQSPASLPLPWPTPSHPASPGSPPGSPQPPSLPYLAEWVTYPTDVPVYSEVLGNLKVAQDLRTKPIWELQGDYLTCRKHAGGMMPSPPPAVLRQRPQLPTKTVL